MRRETTNKLRFVLEDILPAFVRDSALFRILAELAWGKHISRLADFRSRAPFLTNDEYEALYREHPRVHDETDCSDKCINKIAQELVEGSICDVGCGTGALLTRLAERRPGLTRKVGVDFVVDDAAALEGIEGISARIEELPFEDGEFDNVVCTHVIEHILDYRAAIAELRRITRKRLIIIVPREREYLYTFNPHFNFFAYPHSFLRAMIPVPDDFVCIDIGRDIYYREDITS